jgi:hypothetical protein
MFLAGHLLDSNLPSVRENRLRVNKSLLSALSLNDPGAIKTDTKLNCSIKCRHKKAIKKDRHLKV